MTVRKFVSRHRRPADVRPAEEDDPVRFGDDVGEFLARRVRLGEVNRREVGRDLVEMEPIELALGDELLRFRVVRPFLGMIDADDLELLRGQKPLVLQGEDVLDRSPRRIADGQVLTSRPALPPCRNTAALVRSPKRRTPRSARRSSIVRVSQCRRSRNLHRQALVFYFGEDVLMVPDSRIARRSSA